MKKIIIFKNDRVGDLFHSLDGINQIINEHKKDKIEIYLSNYSEGFSFLFDRENISIKIINYNITIKEKINLLKTIILSSIQKIYILSPKKFLFILPLFFKRIKFYAICVDEGNKKRPNEFFRKFLYKFEINDRNYKKKNESINKLIFKLCRNNNLQINNLINIEPINNFDFQKKINFDYCHFHFKKSLFKKKGWTFDNLKELLENIVKSKNKVLLTSDIEETEFNIIFKKNFYTVNFNTVNNDSKLDLNNSVIFLENIKSLNLFYLIKNSSLVIAPHGTMTVVASYLKVPVIDIFDKTINTIAFREYKPNNLKYNFLILKPFSQRLMYKINKFLENV